MLPPPSREQERVLDVFRSGQNVVVSACAGSGKSTLIAHACKLYGEEVCLVLAYNKQLEMEMSAKLHALDIDAHCYTLHGLCSTLFELTPDDDAMHAVLAKVREGALAMRGSFPYRKVLIDEAQDLKPVHVELINAVVSDAQIMAVGDEVQMLYDYDEDDPALLEYMQSPMGKFNTRIDVWQRARLGVSFRLGRASARLANAMLAEGYEQIRGVNAQAGPVRVYTLDDRAWIDVVDPLMRANGCAKMLIVVRKRTNNRALQHLVNELSTRFRDTRFHISGIDGASNQSRLGKVLISTWHAAKGAESKICVTLGVEEGVPHNALHVALTRASRLSVVVQRKSRPCTQLLRVLPDLIRAGDVIADAATRCCITAASEPCADTAAPVLSAHDFTHWSPRGRCLKLQALTHAVVTRKAAEGRQSTHAANCGGFREESAPLMIRAVLMKCEHDRTGSCRAVEDMLRPVCVVPDRRIQMIREGCQKHIAHSSPSVMLPSDLRAAFNAARAAIAAAPRGSHCGREWVTIACASLAWGGYHHQMRQLMPFAWVPTDVFRDMHAALVAELVSADHVSFDHCVTRVYGDVTCHARVPLQCDGAVVHLSYSDEITKRERLHLAVVKALSTAPRAVALNLKTDEALEIFASDPAAVVRAAANLGASEPADGPD